LSLSRYVPWRKIKSWICLRCGGCCKRFKITITSHEYARLLHISEGLVSTDKTGNPVLRRVNGKCVAQDRYGLCTLHYLGMKPLACKLWPFTIFSNLRLANPETLFVHKGREYSVYVDRASPCVGINRGNPEVLPLIIEEVAEIYESRRLTQFLSTSNFVPKSVSYESIQENLAMEKRSLSPGPSGTRNLWEMNVKMR